MSFRAYQKDAQLKADAGKEISDDVDTIQIFRNNVLAPMVRKYAEKYAEKPVAETLAAVCADADPKDIAEGAAQPAKFAALLAFIDGQNYLPNLEK